MSMSFCLISGMSESFGMSVVFESSSSVDKNDRTCRTAAASSSVSEGVLFVLAVEDGSDE